MEISGISVVVLETPRAVGIRAQVEFAAVMKVRPDALISFGTCDTFQPLLVEIEDDAAAGRIDLSRVRVTHLDEFLGFEPEDAGGFANELLQCAPFRTIYEDRRFVPIPSSGAANLLREHEQHLVELGGVQLQFLGIGTNGHVALCEPGTDFDLTFHRATLLPATRDHLALRFAPRPVPKKAVTGGPQNILAAARLVVIATGSEKISAVKGMLDGCIDTGCPASIVRRHKDALVLLDNAAAAGLDWPDLEVAVN